MRACLIALALLGCGHPAPAPAPRPPPAPTPSPPGCRGFPPENLVMFDDERYRVQLVARSPDLDMPEPGEPMLNHGPVDLDGDGHDDRIAVFDCGDDRKCNYGVYARCDATRWIRVWGPSYANGVSVAGTRTTVGGTSWADLVERQGDSCDTTIETTWRFDGRAYRKDAASAHPADCR